LKGYSKWEHCKCGEKYPKGGMCTCMEECGGEMAETCYSKEDEHCHVPKMSVKCSPPTKECVKTYKCCYKLYKFTQYRLYKVCNGCGNEFDHYQNRGMCTKCR
jgi:hypothetical protein